MPPSDKHDVDVTHPSHPPQPPVRRRWRLSPVWLVPLLAALAGLLMLGGTLLLAGPEITVNFRSADGLVPGKTTVRYKAVNIGVVKSVQLSDDRKSVTATIALNNAADGPPPADTRFWVVRPRLDVSGISGLDTLISGAYIGVDMGRDRYRRRHFKGVEMAPAVGQDEDGRRFQLRTQDLGALAIGTPVYYRRVPVGQVVAYKLDPSGDEVQVDIFIRQPYDKLVRADTRFWHAGGVNLKLDANGVRLNTGSLGSVLSGGIAFQNERQGRPLLPAPAGTQFPLAADQTDAMRPQENSPPVVAVLNFNQSLRGLTPGAPVDFRGIVIGRVRSFSAQYVRRDRTFRFPVIVELYPERVGIGSTDMADQQSGRDMARRLNQQGLRAQLRTENLLTGQLYVAFDFFPAAPPAVLKLDGALPEIATIPSSLDQFQTQLASIADKLDKFPFAELGEGMTTAVEKLNTTLANTDTLMHTINPQLLPQANSTLAEAGKSFQSANQLLSSDAPLTQDSRSALRELTQAAASLKNLTDYLARHPESLIRGRNNEDLP